MKLMHVLLAAAAPLALAVPAQAAYVRADFSGSILGANPDAPASLAVGTPITFDIVYDPARSVDHTATFTAAIGPLFSSVVTNSLADDPNASLTIKVGDVTFTKFDEVNYGTPGGDCGPTCDYGVGDFPSLTYLNGSLAGVGNMFVNAQGYVFDADPIADFFGGFDLGDQSVGGYQFFLGRGDGDNPFGDILAVGDYDVSAATFTAVPEPATWSLMIVGFGGLGLVLRGRARQAAAPAA